MRILLFLLFFLSVNCIWAQNVDTLRKKQVLVDHADLFEYKRQKDKTLQILKGGVELRQDSTFMYCDSAIIENQNNVFASGNVIIQEGDSLTVYSDSLAYLGDLRNADLFREVVLVNGEQKLFTDRLNYDLNTKIAAYFQGATLTNETSQLTSKRGYYYVEEETAYFKDSVVVIDSNFVLRADTLKFNTASRIVYFLGPTLINNDTIKLYCEDGFYDIENGIAEFKEQAQFQKGQQQATAQIIRYDGTKNQYLLIGNAQFLEEDKRAFADTILYDEKMDKTFLVGNARYIDDKQEIVSHEIVYDGKTDTYLTKGRSVISNPPQILQANEISFSEENGLGQAVGNVIWQDTSSLTSIICAVADYNQKTDYLKASGGPKGRPMLISVLEGDSLFMAADTMLSFRVDTLATDSNRVLIAYHDVRVFKSDLQVLCDSMVYVSEDSTFNFFTNPIMWSDTSQFSADTIRLVLKEEKIDKIYLTNNALIINSPDEIFYNQVKGRQITATFAGDYVDKMLVEGNAESIYYAQDETKAYVGVNKIIGSEMLLYFNKNQIDKIECFPDPKANLFPMQQIDHEEIKLKGFFWETNNRPKKVSDLFISLGPRSAPTSGQEKEAVILSKEAFQKARAETRKNN